jgi:hypothetical protein
MLPEQINRGHKVEVIFGNGISPLIGWVVNAPHREESHEKLGWLIKDDAGDIYSIGTYAYIRRIE